jgi:hypothetical protein
MLNVQEWQTGNYLVKFRKCTFRCSFLPFVFFSPIQYTFKVEIAVCGSSNFLELCKSIQIINVHVLNDMKEAILWLSHQHHVYNVLISILGPEATSLNQSFCGFPLSATNAGIEQKMDHVCFCMWKSIE